MRSRRINVGKAKSMRRFQIFVLMAAVLSTLVAFGTSHTAFAGVYRPAYNSIETQRKAKCGTSGITRYGAVWINDVLPGNTTMARWNENITVPWNATVVDETMWTTAYNCTDGSSFTNAKIVGLTAGVPTSTISISFPYGTSIVRGTGTTYPGQWTDPPGALRVRINITGVGAPGTKTCFNDAISYIGTYSDSDGTGFSTNYFTDICITRQAQPWTTSATLGIVKLDSAGTVVAGPTYGNITNAAPGDIFGFRYSLRNDGPGPTTSSVTSYRTYTYPSSSQPWTYYTTYSTGKAAGTYLALNSGVGSTGIIPASAGGKSYCLQMRSTPTGLGNSAYLYTPQRCVFVPYNYSLTPTSAIAPGYPDVVPAGGSTKYEYKVTNSGPTYSDPMTYRILQFVMPPGVAINDGGLPYRDNQTANCPAWTSGVCATTLYTSGTVTFIPTAPLTLTVPANASDLTALQTAGMAPGTRVCRLVALAKGSPTTVQRWSRPKCVTVGKKPFISIFNGDGWAGGSFKAIDSTCAATGTQMGGFGGATVTYADGNDYGSYGEYQLFGIGNINSFGSGGRALSAGASPGPATTMSYKATGLFYTPSVGPSTALTSHCIGDALPYYGSIPSSGTLGATVDLASFPTSGVYTRTGDLTINAMTIPAGRHIAIIATGVVTINGNITLANPGGAPYYTNIADIPSFTLINSGTGSASSNYIRVRQAVTQLDGIYQTYHDFVTCAESETGPIGLNSGVCQQQLVVNGAVTANKFVLRRIKGGDPDLVNRNTPAEIFNMRSDVFLSAYGSSQAGGQIRTVSEQELPPRY